MKSGSTQGRKITITHTRDGVTVAVRGTNSSNRYRPPTKAELARATVIKK
jgi:hypothetical protein